MHYIGDKTRQRMISLAILSITAITLAAAAIFYLYWGFKIASTDTLVAAERKGTVIGAVIVLAIILFVFSGFTYVVFRRTHKRRITISYAVMLSFSVGIFLAFTYYGPKIRDDVKDEFARQCKPENVTSDLHKVDTLYEQANVQLCQSSCICNANPDKWNNYSPPKSVVLLDFIPDIKSLPSPPVTKNGMITHEKGVNNWPECPVSKATIETFYNANFKNSGRSLEKGLSLLKAVEGDFECAGMCLPSKYFTFSTVSNGPPPQTCTEGVNKIMDRQATINKSSGIIFLIPTFIGLIWTFLLIFHRKGDLEKPLLS